MCVSLSVTFFSDIRDQLKADIKTVQLDHPDFVPGLAIVQVNTPSLLFRILYPFLKYAINVFETCSHSANFHDGKVCKCVLAGVLSRSGDVRIPMCTSA